MKKNRKVMSIVTASLLSLGVFAFGDTISMMKIISNDSSISLAKSDITVKSATDTATMKVYDAVITNGSTTSSVEKPTDGNTPPTTPPTETKVYATVITDVLNVRSGPSISYTALGVLNYGDKVEAVATNNGWIKIKYGTGTAYISGDYVTLSGSLEEEINTPTSSKFKKIMIDPGHGGSDPGAIGPSSYYEKTFTLDTSLKLKKLLEQNGYTVLMTRMTDITLSLVERVNISNNSKCDLFISIHANSFNETSKGVETYSYQSTGTSAEVAKAVQARLVANLGLTNRGHKTEAFYVLKHNTIPAILIEAAFISNPTEEALLMSSSFQDKVAKSVLEALGSF